MVSLVMLVAWGLSARWTMFFLAQFGDTISLRAGAAAYLWTPPKLREKHVVQFKVARELQWEWHFSERKVPME